MHTHPHFEFKTILLFSLLGTFLQFFCLTCYPTWAGDFRVNNETGQLQIYIETQDKWKPFDPAQANFVTRKDLPLTSREEFLEKEFKEVVDKRSKDGSFRVNRSTGEVEFNSSVAGWVRYIPSQSQFMIKKFEDLSAVEKKMRNELLDHARWVSFREDQFSQPPEIRWNQQAGVLEYKLKTGDAWKSIRSGNNADLLTKQQSLLTPRETFLVRKILQITADSTTPYRLNPGTGQVELKKDPVPMSPSEGLSHLAGESLAWTPMYDGYTPSNPHGNGTVKQLASPLFSDVEKAKLLKYKLIAAGIPASLIELGRTHDGLGHKVWIKNQFLDPYFPKVIPPATTHEIGQFSAVVQAGLKSNEASSCPTFDHRHLMGPTRDQGKRGLCWGNAAAEILQEAMCISGVESMSGTPEASVCGKSLSVLDLIKQENKGTNSSQGGESKTSDSDTSAWLLGSASEGFNSPIALNKYVKDRPNTRGSFPQQGVCLDEHAPYLADSDDSTVRNLRAVYEQYRAQSSLDSCPQPSDPLTNKLTSMISLLTAMQPKTMNELLGPLVAKARWELMHKSVHEYSSFEDFLQAMLIPEKCIDNQLKLPKGVVEIRQTESHACLGSSASCKEGTQQFNQVKKDVVSYIQDHHSAGIHICASRYVAEQSGSGAVGPVSQGDCGAHAIVINQMWPVTKADGTIECMVNLKNSWGENNTILHGPTPLAKVIPYIYETFGMRNK